MKDVNLPNLLVAAAIVVVALVVLGFASTLITILLPLTIVAVVAFILGRMSANTNLLNLGTNLFKRASNNITKARAQAKVETKSESKTVTSSEASLTERQNRLAEKEEPAAEAGFTLRSEQEVLSAARRREEEIIAKSRQDYDPMTAIEERKKRLLGDKGE